MIKRDVQEFANHSITSSLDEKLDKLGKVWGLERKPPEDNNNFYERICLVRLTGSVMPDFRLYES